MAIIVYLLKKRICLGFVLYVKVTSRYRCQTLINGEWVCALHTAVPLPLAPEPPSEVEEEAEEETKTASLKDPAEPKTAQGTSAASEAVKGFFY